MEAVQLREIIPEKGRKPAKPVSHNLNGQKLGRKGRDTRDRILAAANELLAEPGAQITLSAVARKAGLGMTSLYAYFTDLTELLLAVLEPIMATAEDAYLAHLRKRWPDEELSAHCVEFLQDYYRFWQKHTRILHMRNSLSEGSLEPRMVQHRINAGVPMVQLLTRQMDGDPQITASATYCMATALFTGLDRLIAVRTTTEWSTKVQSSFQPELPMQMQAEARLIELAIRDARGL